MAPRLRSAVVRFDALPLAALRVLFLALPMDERARAACVCRSWRAFLADPSLWHVLDLTPAGGVVAARVTENLVRSAVHRAAGQLRSLSLEWTAGFRANGLLVELVQTDGAALQQLNTAAWMSAAELGAVFAAAPRLQVNARVGDLFTALLPVLRNDPPYGPLRIAQVFVDFSASGFFQPTVADVRAVAAAVAAHESLKGMNLANAQFAPELLNELIDVAAARLSRLTISRCVLNAGSVPALTRLLQRGCLTMLSISCDGFPHAQAASVPVLCAALRSCRTLEHLELRLDPPNGASHRTVTEVLDVAASLPMLSQLSLWGSEVQDIAAFGRALGAFLHADLPRLRTLYVFDNRLNDDAMAALLDGLAANTHLRQLLCHDNDLSRWFECYRLEPALAALEARALLDE